MTMRGKSHRRLQTVRPGAVDAICGMVVRRISYISGDFDDPHLRQAEGSVGQADQEQTRTATIFYNASRQVFGDIVSGWRKSPDDRRQRPLRRVITRSLLARSRFRKALNQQLLKVATEHRSTASIIPGKETVQNI